jgi:ABC-type polar amino acid transport system ATPase subunit
MSASPPAVEALGLRKRFGAAEVLRGVDLSVAPGETVAIIGPSGGGKSTLIRCLNALERPDAGSVRVGGVDLAGPGGEAARRTTAMVFQGFNLFPHLTVLGNVALAPVHVARRPRAEAEARALAVLERVGIADQAGKRPAELSGGQQQRAAIARALATDPAVMLLDEPTSALDPESVGEVLDVVADLAAGGMTVVMVTHEMAFAREAADRVVVLDAGQVIEQGPPAQLFAAPTTERTRAFLRRVRAA